MRWLPTLLLLFATDPVWAQAVVTIPADATVQGPQITLGEIAQLDGLDPAQARELSSLPLGRAAAPARERVFSGASLRQRIRQVVTELRVEAPDKVRVHTAHREIAPDFVRSHVERAIRHKMPWPDAAVTFSVWRLPERFAVPASAERVLVHFRREESFLRRVHAEIELIGSGANLPQIRRSASVNLSVELPVVVTTVDLRRGAILDAGSIKLAEREFGGVPRNVLRELEHVIGMQLARGLPAGTPLVPGYLRYEHIIKRGDSVSVLSESMGISVRLGARALEAGALGETIRVENAKTRYRFRAEVTGPGTARLHGPQVGSGP